MPDPIRLSLIDASNIEDHSRLQAGDICYHLFEYTSRQNYSFSDTNSLISNLKKKPSLRHTSAYRWKTSAIQQCSTQLRRALSPDWLAHAVIVPIPPSKAEDHPEYDDRIEQICRGMGADVDVRNLVRQLQSMNASHESSIRPDVDELVANYYIDEKLCASGDPSAIGIVDDVLTAGTHFKAMQRVLHARFPSSPISGLFIARRIFPAVENLFPVIDDED